MPRVIRNTVMLAAVLGVLGTACTTASADPDPQTADTCEQLADSWIALDQDFLDELGDRSTEEYQQLFEGRRPDTLLTRYQGKFDQFQPRGDELGCSVEQMESLICDRKDRLEPGGPAGEAVIDRLEARQCTEGSPTPSAPSGGNASPTASG
jgi:hypothetical protein